MDRESNSGRAGTRNPRGLGFIDHPWGEKAREFVKTTKRIDESLWDSILQQANLHLDSTDRDGLDEDDNDNSDEDGSSVNPRGVINLDW
jgi:hypothetical protein